MFTATEVIVIDYKFTKNRVVIHVKQVHGYRDLLREMGYPKVCLFILCHDWRIDFSITASLKHESILKEVAEDLVDGLGNTLLQFCRDL
ncbi:hypothetical protein CS542_08560 [Pedobacter sp. IW39]|nr:hypothetical protein CS542_08560 [Pedobacter sp. IW39]